MQRIIDTSPWAGIVALVVVLLRREIGAMLRSGVAGNPLEKHMADVVNSIVANGEQLKEIKRSSEVATEKLGEIINIQHAIRTDQAEQLGYMKGSGRR